MIIRNNVVFDINKKSDLSNGDTVIVTASYDNKVLSDLGYVMVRDSYEYEVQGLDELMEVNVLDNLVVSFEGYNGDGTLLVLTNSSNAELDDVVTYSYSKEQKLSNGEIIEIDVAFDEKNSWKDGIYYY